MARKAAKTRARKAARPQGGEAEPLRWLSVELPESVVTAVHVEAARSRLPLRAVVARALAAVGFNVSEADQVDRRVRENKRRGERAKGTK